MTEKRAALIVASYQYEDPDLRQLVAPAQDAEALVRVLKDPAIGGFEVQVLLNQPSHQVSQAVEAFFVDRRRDDLLLLYFSGHGIKDDAGRLYFATTNTRRKMLRTTAIPATLVNDLMRYSRSRRQVLLLDCCYSGAFARGMVVRGSEDIGTGEYFEEGRGLVVLTASDAMQYAFEGDQIKGEGVRSVFTHTLVHGLETGEADLDRDGHVSLDELYDYIYDCVTDKMPQQKPEKWDFGVQGEIIIAANPQPVEVEPLELPLELQQAIESPFAWVREGAVRELDRLLRGSNEKLQLAAHAALTQLIDDDSRTVSQSAAKSLSEYSGVQGEAEEPGTTEKQIADLDPSSRKTPSLFAKMRLVAQSPGWWRGTAVVVCALALIMVAASVLFLLPPRYDTQAGGILWVDDHLLWGVGSMLSAIPASATKLPDLVVGGVEGEIRAVSQDAQGQLWLGLAGDGLYYQQGKEWIQYVFTGGTDTNTVQAIASSSPGKGIWVGTRDGAAYFNGKEWTFPTSPDVLSSDIRAITVAPDGTVWFGTWGFGLASLAENDVAPYRLGEGKTWNRITSLQIVGEYIWVGTQSGLVQFDPGDKDRTVFYSRSNGLPDDFVTALATDRSGRLWIGTWGGGVATLDNGEVVPHTLHPKKFNYVMDLEVGDNKVWVMSPAGIMILDLETERWFQYY